MRCRERLEAYLRENGVPFQVQHHPLVFTAQEVAAQEHVPGKMMAKVVMAMAGGKMVMLVLPAPNWVDLAKVGAFLGVVDVRLASETEFAAAFPDCQTGAMPPFGNLYDMPVYVDKSLEEDENIVFQAGSHTDTMSMKYSDFDLLAKPRVADLARHR